MKRKHLLYAALIVPCPLVLALPTRARQQKRGKEKLPDLRQIRQLEQQLSNTRRDLDELRENPSQPGNIPGIVPQYPQRKFILTQFISAQFFVQGKPYGLRLNDCFHLADRVVTVRPGGDTLQITGYGIVIEVEADNVQIVPLHGSSTHLEDEVYVANREDTPASLANEFVQRPPLTERRNAQP